MTFLNQAIVTQAARLKCSIPHPSFTYTLALVCAGCLPAVAEIADIINDLRTVVNSIEEREIHCTSEIENIKQRCRIIWTAATRLPKLNKNHLSNIPLESIKSKSQTDVLRLAGLTRGPSDDRWVRCKIDLNRFVAALKTGQGLPVTNTRSQTNSPRSQLSGRNRTPFSVVDLNVSGTSTSIQGRQFPQTPEHCSSSRESVSTQSSEISDLTESPRYSESCTTSSRDTSDTTTTSSSETRYNAAARGNSSRSSKNTQVARGSNVARISVSSRSASSRSKTSTGSSVVSQKSDFSKLVRNKANRKTVTQAQNAREDDVAYKDIFSTAHILGTVMYDRMRLNKCPLVKFKSVDDVAEFINNGFEYDFISGRQIREAVAKGKVGEEPTSKGRPTTVSADDLSDIASLVFTAQTIEQVNAAPTRLKRKNYVSIVGNIVNSARTSQGLPEVDDANFYKKIEKDNARRSSLTSTDKREVLRHAWLTYEQQNKHHENWEKTLIDLGFGRAPLDEEERRQEGNVVLTEEERSRILNFDEMGFALDGSSNSIGGRPGAVPTNKQFPENGTASLKSDHRFTIMFGINMVDEAIPPLIVLPSSAITPKIHLELLQDLHQIEGQWGYKDGKRQKFACSIATAEKGGVTAEIFKKWYNEDLRLLYPFADDVVGKRVISKSDGGPGRKDSQYLAEARADGFYQHPGLPNGTSLGQEMDHMYYLTKAIMAENRDLLWGKRYELDGEKARVDLRDIGKILFGGNVSFRDGTSIVLRNAYQESMSAKAIASARKKCGYVPATRASLKSNKLRHELIETPQGEIDHDSVDPSTLLLHNIELLNHQMVAKLEGKGYTLAKDLKRSASRVSAAAVMSRQDAITEPGTTARQKLLMKATTAGSFFKVTNGGIPMNCDDCLIALEMKCYEKDIAKLEKQKANAGSYKKLEDSADEVLQKKGSDYTKWNKGDLVNMIRWKDPERTLAGLRKQDPQDLKILWDTTISAMEPPTSRWRKKDQKLLEKMKNGLETGDVGPVDKTGIYKRAVAARYNFLEAKLSEMPKKKSLDLAAMLLRKHLDSEHEVFTFSEKCYNDNDSTNSNHGHVSDEDDLSYQSDEESYVSGVKEVDSNVEEQIQGNRIHSICTDNEDSCVNEDESDGGAAGCAPVEGGDENSDVDNYNCDKGSDNEIDQNGNADNDNWNDFFLTWSDSEQEESVTHEDGENTCGSKYFDTNEEECGGNDVSDVPVALQDRSGPLKSAIGEYTVPELKKELRTLGLKLVGRKQELFDRLQQHYA